MTRVNTQSRFIEMFQDAPKTKLGDFCELKARIGWQGLKHEEFLDNGDYYLVTGVDFTGTSIDWSRCHFVTKERYDQDPYIQLHNGDILVTKDGTIGKVAIVSGLETPATLNSGVFVLRDKKGLTLNSFLFYCLLSKEFERFVEDCKTGSTIAHLNQKAFVNYLIPTPELKAQEQFVSFATQADKSKFSDFKSRFIEMSSSWHKQGVIRDLVDDKITRASKRFTPSDIIQYIDISSVDSESNHVTSTTEYKLSDAPSRAQQCTEYGDILISTVRPNLKNIAINQIVGDNTVASSGFCVLRPRTGYQGLLLAYVLSEPFTEKMVAEAKGSNYPAIHDSDVLSYPITIPEDGDLENIDGFIRQSDKSKYLN